MKKINLKRFLFNWIICFALMMPATLLKAQTTLVLQPDNTTGKDAFVFFQDITPSASSTNYGESTYLEAKWWTGSGQPKGSRSFLEFDLSSIPSSESIISATLSLYHDGSTTLHGGGLESRYSQSSFYIRRVTSAWLENTVTWDNQPTATTQNQVAVPAPTSGTTDYPDIDVTQLIKDIIDNGNYGLQVILQNEAIYRSVRFGSCENDLDGGANRPKLEVVYQSTTLKEGLVSVWEFDETSGSIANDSHGSNHRTTTNVTIVPGKIGNCLSFNGTNSFVDLGQIYDQTTGALSMWFKPTNINGRLFGQDEDWEQRWVSSAYTIDIGNPAPTSTTTSWSSSTWYHVIFTWDKNDGTQLWVQGVLEHEVTGNGFPTLGSETMSIGASHKNGVYTGYFTGLIDQVITWDKKLSSGEIAELYNSGDGLAYSDWGSGTGTVPLAGNSITAPAVSLPIDYNTSPGEISGSLPTGGDCGGTYTYTWEASTDGGYSWGTVGGNTQSYTPGQLTQDISYRRTVSCGSASSTSNVVAITVNPEVMACTGNVSNFPYTENFEVSSSDWVNDDDNDVDWIRNSGGTPNDYTGPSSAYMNDYYCYMPSTITYRTAYLNGPCFNLEGHSSASFSFYYHMYGDNGNTVEDMGSLYLEMSEDEGLTWNSIWSKTGNQGDTWYNQVIDLTSYVGSTIQLRFKGHTLNSSRSDIALDYLRLTTVPITELIAGTLQVENPTIYSGYSPGLISDSQASTGGDCSGTYEYSWQYLEDGESSWVDISNEDGASYEPGALTVTTTFRRTVTCGSETASSEITITVLEGGTSTPIIIGTPANGLSLTDQVLTLDAASSTSTGALTSIDWNTFNSNDYYGYWWFQAGTGANAAIGSGDKISLVAGDGIAITESVSTDGKDRDVTFSVIGGGTVSDGNNHPNALTFNTGTGDLTLGIEGMSDLVENLDGRYMLGSNTLELNDLNDVTISNPQNGQVLKLVDNVWQASADLLGETGIGDDWGTQVVQTDGTTITGDGDITPISLLQQGATDGQILKWSDTLGRWAPGQDNSGTGSQSVVTDNLTLTGTGSELDSLKLAQQGATNGQVLKWNDSLNRWAPGSDIGLEGSSTMWQSSGNNIYYSSGSVSVGLEDTTQNLNVNGTIYSKEVKVQTVIPQPDYVFEEDYPLKSLSSVESFINENKHLPEIPSAKEVAKNGVDLAAMNMLLLRKVEELTLYLFQQENRIKELESKLKSNGTPEN